MKVNPRNSLMCSISPPDAEASGGRPEVVRWVDDFRTTSGRFPDIAILRSGKRPLRGPWVDVFRTSKWQCPETVRKSSGSRPPTGRPPDVASCARRRSAPTLTVLVFATCYFHFRRNARDESTKCRGATTTYVCHVPYSLRPILTISRIRSCCSCDYLNYQIR